MSRFLNRLKAFVDHPTMHLLIGCALVITGGTATFNSGEATSVASFNQSGGTLTGSDNLTITGGAIPTFPTSPGGGAGIFNDGDLTLDRVVLTGNHVYGGGSNGGGIASPGRLAVLDSVISNNSASPASYGGGIFGQNVRLCVSNCVVAGST